MSTVYFKKPVVVIILFSLSLPLLGQDIHHRNLIDKIEEVGSFRTVSMTRNNGEVVVFNDNTFYESGCPVEFVAKVSELSPQGIIALQHTDKGNWLIVYNENDFVYSGIPSDMIGELRRIKQSGKTIISASFCDIGYWLILVEGEGDAVSSLIGSPYLIAFSRATARHGVLTAFYLTDEAGIGVYQYGILTYGHLPSSLIEMVNGNNESKIFTGVAFSGDNWVLNYASGMFSYNE